MPIAVTTRCDERGCVEERTGICKCGIVIDLMNMTNECPHCGTLYNWAGQELRPEGQWKEPYDPE